MLNITQFYYVRNREMLKNKIPPRSIFHIVDIVRGLKTELLPQVKLINTYISHVLIILVAGGKSLH